MKPGTRKASDVVMSAMELIGDESRWTKHSFAVDKNGIAVDRFAKEACKFCIVGAVSVSKNGKLTHSNKEADYLKEAVVVATSGKSFSIAAFNDKPTVKHRDVMNVMMTAALLALADGE